MHIFIDESGTFAIPQEGALSPCVIGALVIPDFKVEKLFRKYETLRQNLPQDGSEVKGRLLNELEVFKVVELLRRNNCIFVAHVIEMGRESVREIEDHRKNAAEGLTRHLTKEHHPELVEGVWQRRAELEQMSLPLYVQYSLMSYLLGDLLRHVPVYWAQRRMAEILDFHWVVDGKGEGDLTKSEDWWSTLKGGFLQSKLARDPMIALEGVNYEAFDAKFKVPMPDYLKETILPYDEGFSLNLILDESFRFSSGNDPGLELVDIVTNATRRALKGNLSAQGWQDIPRLMIHHREHYLRMVGLSKSASTERLPYGRIIARDFARNGRSMLTK